MSRGWQYKSGDWYVSCDVCSKQIYASESRKRWDGLIVCPDDFEHRHPQDLIRVRGERIGVPFTRIEPTEVFNDSYGLIDFWSAEDILQLTWEYVREYTDSVNSSDSIIFDVGKSLTDSIVVVDGISFQSTALLGLTDTVTMSSSGDLFIFDYVDSTYVGIDYVGSSIGTIT